MKSLLFKIWIEENVPKEAEQQLGKCTVYVPLMKEQFPELIVCRGVVSSADNLDNFGVVNKQYPHMWLETVDGEIIDPTANQFSLLGKLDYEKFPEHVKEMSKCFNCGRYFYEKRHAPFCSLQCHIQYEEP